MQLPYHLSLLHVLVPPWSVLLGELALPLEVEWTSLANALAKCTPQVPFFLQFVNPHPFPLCMRKSLQHAPSFDPCICRICMILPPNQHVWTS